MQLQNLKIKNFRTIEEMSLNPGNINVITGPNGAGKSSLLEAISFLLTGKAGADIIRKGTEFAEVSGTVHGAPIIRKKGETMSVKMNGKATTQKSFQQWIEETTGGITTDTMRVATSSGLLASMNSRELAEYLINNNLIPVEIDMDVLKTLCTISEAAEAELSKYLPPVPCTFTTDDVQQAYSALYAIRPTLKKEIAEMEAKASGIAGMTSARTMDDIDKDIAKLSAYGAEVAAYNKLFLAYMDAKQRREKMEQEIVELENKVKSANISVPDAAILEKLQNEAKSLNELMLYAKQVIATSNSNLEMYRRTLENLDKPVCPISEKLICTTDKSGIKEDITKLINENEARIAESRALLGKHEINLDAVNDKINGFHKRERAYMEMQSIVARIDAMKKGLPVIPEKPVRPEEIPDAANIMNSLKREREIVMAKDIAEKAAKEIPVLKEKLSICEELIKLLSPKGGLREQIIQAAFEPMVEHCNELAAKLHKDIRIDLVANDGIAIMCKPAGTTQFLPLEAVSSGEQLLAMMLILDAIEALSGLGILVLDDLDKLDADALEALFCLLDDPEYSGAYDHIFVAMVNHEDALRVIEKHKANISNWIAY